MTKNRRVWKVRVVKPYPEAHNHLVVGEVLEETATWLRMKGRTYHFGRVAQRVQDIKVGPHEVRIIPWARIEIVNELPASFDYARAKLSEDGKGNVVLTHDRYGCPIATSYKEAT